jgi:hypothetical protein
MTSTRTSRFVTRLSFAGLIGLGLAAGIAGTADAAPGDTIKVGPTVPTTAKPGPQDPNPDLPLKNPKDPCKVTHGAPKDCPEPDHEPDPCAGDACDRPVPGKPTFTG